MSTDSKNPRASAQGAVKVTATRWTTNQLLALGASASGRRTGLALQESRYNPKPPGTTTWGMRFGWCGIRGRPHECGPRSMLRRPGYVV